MRIIMLFTLLLYDLFSKFNCFIQSFSPPETFYQNIPVCLTKQLQCDRFQAQITVIYLCVVFLL